MCTISILRTPPAATLELGNFRFHDQPLCFEYDYCRVRARQTVYLCVRSGIMCATYSWGAHDTSRFCSRQARSACVPHRTRWALTRRMVCVLINALRAHDGQFAFAPGAMYMLASDGFYERAGTCKYARGRCAWAPDTVYVHARGEIRGCGIRC